MESALATPNEENETMESALATIGLAWSDRYLDDGTALEEADIEELRADIEAWREAPIEGDREAESDWRCLVAAIASAKERRDAAVQEHGATVDQLLELIRRKGLTQATAAQRLGYSIQAIQGMCQGRLAIRESVWLALRSLPDPD